MTNSLKELRTPKIDDKNPYADIIDLPRPDLGRRAMSRASRAAQFSPFSALDSFEETIENTEFLLDKLT